MKIEKAIKINTFLIDVCNLHDQPDQVDAVKLGIEALKVRDNLRFEGSPYYPNLLPGEDE